MPEGEKGQQFANRICILSDLHATNNTDTGHTNTHSPESPLASAERKLLQDSRKKTDVSSSGFSHSRVNLVRWKES